MAKTYGGNRKWTTGRSRVVRPENQVKLDRGLKESIKQTKKKTNIYVSQP